MPYQGNGRGDYLKRDGGRLVTAAPTPPLLAKVTTAAIAAESTGEVTLQKPDWTDTTRTISDCQNDSSFELAVGTKVYIMRIAGSWRIIWAGGECPA